jgi:hypothetical protein
MGMPVNTPRTWRFGVFELDALSGELRRNWHRRQAARTAGAHSAPVVALHCSESPSTGQDAVRIALTQNR